MGSGPLRPKGQAQAQHATLPDVPATPHLEPHTAWRKEREEQVPSVSRVRQRGLSSVDGVIWGHVALSLGI